MRQTLLPKSPTLSAVQRTFLMVFLCATMGSGTAHSSNIGVFADAAGTDCDITIAMFTPFNIYVVAETRGDEAATCGVLRADFRVTGIPASWFVNATPNPAGIGDGNVLGTGGGVEFTACQPPGPSILLYSLFGFATTLQQHFVIFPQERLDVVDACNTSQPMLTVCDQSETPLCAFGGELLVNYGIPCTTLGEPAPVSKAAGACQVAVEPRSWGAVKRLYLD